MSFLSETVKVPVFILDTATETDRVIFVNSSIFTKTHHFFSLTPTSFQRLQIPKQMAEYSSLIVSHRNGEYPAIYPITADNVLHLTSVSFLKSVIDRAIEDKKTSPHRRKAKKAPTTSRLSLSSS